MASRATPVLSNTLLNVPIYITIGGSDTFFYNDPLVEILGAVVLPYAMPVSERQRMARGSNFWSLFGGYSQELNIPEAATGPSIPVLGPSFFQNLSSTGIRPGIRLTF